ncbi:hypothetical protein [Actinophytocola sp.]|uniref:hypothetical protein n=1 Tax=Actinophytocola sp. TaxID=1872138 RepID=UPI003D6A93D3
MPDSTRNYSRAAFRAFVKHVRAEPVAFQGVIQATLALLVGFGVLTWTTEQTGLTLALTAAILGFLTRRKVTPSGRAVAGRAGARTG